MAIDIALLRGINVGGNRKIPMADLRALCEKTGFSEVKTYIQSGNIVFRSAGSASAAEKKLERAIEERFGFEVDVLVRNAKQWTTYMAENPFPAMSEKEPHRVMMILSKSPPEKDAVLGLRPRAIAGEQLEAVGEAIWAYYPGGAGTSKLSPALFERLVGSPVTARNWRTVQVLAGLAGLTRVVAP